MIYCWNAASSKLIRSMKQHIRLRTYYKMKLILGCYSDFPEIYIWWNYLFNMVMQRIFPSKPFWWNLPLKTNDFCCPDFIFGCNILKLIFWQLVERKIYTVSFSDCEHDNWKWIISITKASLNIHMYCNDAKHIWFEQPKWKKDVNSLIIFYKSIWPSLHLRWIHIIRSTGIESSIFPFKRYNLSYEPRMHWNNWLKFACWN